MLFSPKEENSECYHSEASHNSVSAFIDFFLGIYIPIYMYIITKRSIAEFYSLIFSLSILWTFFIYQTYFCNSLTVQYSIVFLSAPNFIQFSSVAQSCPTLCSPMNRSTPGLPVHHQLPEFTQTHVHWVSDAIQPSHPLSSPSPPAPNPSQHQSLFQWVNSWHEVAKVLEFQL